MERNQGSDRFPLGSTLPKFELLNVNGKTVNDTYFQGAKAGLVIFTCNHCPYVKGSEEMLLKIVRKYSAEGLRTVAISANDAAQYPEDSFENMQRHAAEFDLPYPYLYDETQQVAKLFDAACTPECYLFDAKGKLVYHGTINDNPRDGGKVTTDFLSPAIESTLAGREPQNKFVHPIGCSIKWKLSNLRE